MGIVVSPAPVSPHSDSLLWVHACAHLHTHSPGRQVLKVAILAEKYAVDYSWYVDTILNLIRIAGDYVSEEVWYRVLQIVTNRDDVQGYAAKTVFEVSTPPCTVGHQGRAGTAGAVGLAVLGPHSASSSEPPKGHGGQQSMGMGCSECSQ